MTIGERVKQRRKELGLSQEELAIRMGNRSRASVCAIEKDRDDLTTTRIRKLAKALETTPEYLMGWEVEVETVAKESQADRTKHLAELYMYILEAYAAADDGIKSAVDKLLDVKKEDDNGKD